MPASRMLSSGIKAIVESVGVGMTITDTAEQRRLTAKYVNAMWTDTRSAALKMVAAHKEWEKLSDEINDWMDRSHIEGIVQRNEIRGNNLALAAAYSAWSYWSGTVTALSAAIQVEKTARELLDSIE